MKTIKKIMKNYTYTIKDYPRNILIFVSENDENIFNIHITCTANEPQTVYNETHTSGTSLGVALRELKQKELKNWVENQIPF